MRLDEEYERNASRGITNPGQNDNGSMNGHAGAKGSSAQPRGPTKPVQAQPDTAWRDEMESICKQELELHNIEMHQRIVRLSLLALSCGTTIAVASRIVHLEPNCHAGFP